MDHAKLYAIDSFLVNEIVTFLMTAKNAPFKKVAHT